MSVSFTICTVYAPGWKTHCATTTWYWSKSSLPVPKSPSTPTVIQVVPKGGFYDFQSKYTPGQTEYLLPAPLPAGVTARLQSEALASCRALGCRGAARVDFIVRDEELFCLEVNTIPGMTETSLLPKAAGAAGISFSELVLRILADAGLNK